jgi:predicted secreted protein
MRIKGNSMLLKKTVFVTLLILLTFVSAIWAGDSAAFVDLGFSPDGRTYMFGQYGVLSPSLRPWAELYVVDVGSNNFVQNGRAAFTENAAIRAGQDGSGVFHRLLSDNSSVAHRYGINFQNQGLPLYISRDDNLSERGERIDFRDFISGKTYKAELIPSINGSGQSVRSSFYINLEVRSQNGQVRNYTVGHQDIVRQKIASYNIKRVIIDANGGSVIFVIEMRCVAGTGAENGYDIRYMVEALRL